MQQPLCRNADDTEVEDCTKKATIMCDKCGPLCSLCDSDHGPKSKHVRKQIEHLCFKFDMDAPGNTFIYFYKNDENGKRIKGTATRQLADVKMTEKFPKGIEIVDEFPYLIDLNHDKSKSKKQNLCFKFDMDAPGNTFIYFYENDENGKRVKGTATRQLANVKMTEKFPQGVEIVDESPYLIDLNHKSEYEQKKNKLAYLAALAKGDKCDSKIPCKETEECDLRNKKCVPKNLNRDDDVVRYADKKGAYVGNKKEIEDLKAELMKNMVSSESESSKESSASESESSKESSESKEVSEPKEASEEKKESEPKEVSEPKEASEEKKESEPKEVSEPKEASESKDESEDSDIDLDDTLLHDRIMECLLSTSKSTVKK